MGSTRPKGQENSMKPILTSIVPIPVAPANARDKAKITVNPKKVRFNTTSALESITPTPEAGSHEVSGSRGLERPEKSEPSGASQTHQTHTSTTLSASQSQAASPYRARKNLKDTSTAANAPRKLADPEAAVPGEPEVVSTITSVSRKVANHKAATPTKSAETSIAASASHRKLVKPTIRLSARTAPKVSTKPANILTKPEKDRNDSVQGLSSSVSSETLTTSRRRLQSSLSNLNNPRARRKSRKHPNDRLNAEWKAACDAPTDVREKKLKYQAELGLPYEEDRRRFPWKYVDGVPQLRMGTERHSEAVGAKHIFTTNDQDFKAAQQTEADEESRLIEEYYNGRRAAKNHRKVEMDAIMKKRKKPPASTKTPAAKKTQTKAGTSKLAAPASTQMAPPDPPRSGEALRCYDETLASASTFGSAGAPEHFHPAVHDNFHSTVAPLDKIYDAGFTQGFDKAAVLYDAKQGLLWTTMGLPIYQSLTEDAREGILANFNHAIAKLNQTVTPPAEIHKAGEVLYAYWTGPNLQTEHEQHSKLLTDGGRKVTAAYVKEARRFSLASNQLRRNPSGRMGHSEFDLGNDRAAHDSTNNRNRDPADDDESSLRIALFGNKDGDMDWDALYRRHMTEQLRTDIPAQDADIYTLACTMHVYVPEVARSPSLDNATAVQAVRFHRFRASPRMFSAWSCTTKHDQKIIFTNQLLEGILTTDDKDIKLFLFTLAGKIYLASFPKKMPVTYALKVTTAQESAPGSMEALASTADTAHKVAGKFVASSTMSMSELDSSLEFTQEQPTRAAQDLIDARLPIPLSWARNWLDDRSIKKLHRGHTTSGINLSTLIEESYERYEEVDRWVRDNLPSGAELQSRYQSIVDAAFVAKHKDDDRQTPTPLLFCESHPQITGADFESEEDFEKQISDPRSTGLAEAYVRLLLKSMRSILQLDPTQLWKWPEKVQEAVFPINTRWAQNSARKINVDGEHYAARLARLDEMRTLTLDQRLQHQMKLAAEDEKAQTRKLSQRQKQGTPY
ncbi:unnamed protein product [Zymoseptoria tritici ST99CH_1E4]|uniref:Uncharacterized protein n=1 Tax=Zymoseptoria tritici ST99CH_1E4 TaxID=1276532 RepID=A0A2H1H8U6_ZYMTR|nr:unnamed protein product [Zymoseptoria tritici ST99CH_1E4]